MPDAMLGSLAAMTENALRTEVIIPLLNKTSGIFQVTDVHGVNEKGLDVIFFTQDAIRKTCYGMQLKRGNISGGGSSDKTVQQIINQLDLAQNFAHPVAVPPSGRYTIDRFIVATNGRISSSARDEIASRIKSVPVEFWDQNEIMGRISEIYPELLGSADLAMVDYLRAVRQRCDTLDSLDQVTGVGRRSLSEVFVDRSVRRRFDPSVAATTDRGGPSPVLSAMSLLDADENFILLGEQDGGKSATLRMLAIKSIDRRVGEDGESARIPVLFRASDIVSAGSVRVAAGKAAEKLGATEIRDDLTDGEDLSDYWFLVDGFSELLDERHKITCAELLEGFGKNCRARITVTGRPNDFLHPRHFNSFVQYTMEPFSSSQVRSLVGRWTEDGSRAQDVANKLVARVKEALQLPGSPIPAIIGVMLYEKEGQFITNTAEAVDRYMVIRLGRYAEEMDLSMSVTWTRKQDLLAEVAFRMVEEGLEAIEERRAVRIMDTRFEKLGEESQSERAVAELVDAGVLRREGDELTFFRTAFRDFFAAHWVNTHIDSLEEFFKLRMFDRRWGAVLVFAAGLRRRNGALLDALNTKVEEESQQLSVSPSEDYIYGAYLIGRILSNSEATEESSRIAVLRTCVKAASASADELAVEAQEQFGNIGQIVGLIGSEQTFFVTVGVPWLQRQFEKLSSSEDLSEEERYLLTSVYANLGGENWLDVLAEAVSRARSPKVLVALSILVFQLANMPRLKRDETEKWQSIEKMLKRKKRRLSASIEQLLEVRDPLIRIEQERMKRLGRGGT